MSIDYTPQEYVEAISAFNSSISKCEKAKAKQLAEYGFVSDGVAVDIYAQVVKLLLMRQ
ncbi:MAG: hypothetical protein FWH55_00010 [Oscillospiraceae bacterium]|nr:hypothetical protein [Oscillospiraceae bacterium]